MRGAGGHGFPTCAVTCDAWGQEQRGNHNAVVVQSDLLPLSTWLVAPNRTGPCSAQAGTPDGAEHFSGTKAALVETAADDWSSE